MISQEDFSVISRLDSGDQASRDKVAKEAPQQCAKTSLLYQDWIVVIKPAGTRW